MSDSTGDAMSAPVPMRSATGKRALSLSIDDEIKQAKLQKLRITALLAEEQLYNTRLLNRELEVKLLFPQFSFAFPHELYQNPADDSVILEY